MNPRTLGLGVTIVGALWMSIALVSAQQRASVGQEPPGSLAEAIQRAFAASPPVLQTDPKNPDAQNYMLPVRVSRPSAAPWALPPGAGRAAGRVGAGTGSGGSNSGVIQYQIGTKDGRPLYAQFAIPADETMFEGALSAALKQVESGRPEAQACNGQYVCDEYNPDGSCKRKKCVPKKAPHGLGATLLLLPPARPFSW
jgi:hypothetical protein